jgi:hypothetical protein
MDERPTTTADLAGESDEAIARDPDATETETETERLDPILPAEEAEGLRGRWQELQTAFVDDPRNVVEQADALVAELMQRVAQTFADERKGLEGQWSRGEDVSTEDLRVALQRYRSFFERLLAT